MSLILLRRRDVEWLEAQCTAVDLPADAWRENQPSWFQMLFEVHRAGPWWPDLAP